MASMSNYLENAVIDWLVRGQPLTQLGTVYLALGSLENPLPVFDVDSGEFYFGHGVDEIDSPSYARVPVSCGPTHWSATDNSSSTAPASTGSGATTYLLDAVAFPVCREVWSPSAVTHLGVFDAPTGGNLLWYGAFDRSFVTAPGMQVRFPAASIAIALATNGINFRAPAGTLMSSGLPWMIGTSFVIPDASPAPPPPVRQRLSVVGSEIRKPDGSPITMRGWNWGRFGTMQPQDAGDNVEQGANVVRIPLRWYGNYPPGVDSRNDAATATAGIDPGVLAQLDDMVYAASASKLWIILFIDSDCGQNGLQSDADAAFCDPNGLYPSGHNLWRDDDLKARFINVWKFVADRYKDTPYIGLFEILPEPNPTGITPTQVSALYQEVMAAIDTVAGSDVPFLVGPTNVYDITKASQAYIPGRSDVVYTGDFFMHPNGTQDAYVAKITNRLSFLIALRAAHNVPIFVQQVGTQTSDDPGQFWDSTALTMLNDNDIGWTYWEYRGSTSPDDYGPYYRDAVTDEWILKPAVMDTITSFFTA